MTVEILFEDGRWEAAGLAALAERAAAAALAHLGLEPEGCEISVLACDDARIAELNAAFRGKRSPTNVLSWPAEALAAAAEGARPAPPTPAPAGMEIALGDIAIAYETCAREAEAQGVAFGDHVTHLVVHGCLHLLGYDHTRPQDAALMERIEVEILAKLGVADPYG